MKLKIIIKIFIYKLVYIFRSFLNISNEKILYLFLNELRKSSLDNNSSELLTEFKIYPKKPKRIFPVNSETKNTTIIIQGPANDRDFIQSSINWYKDCGVKNLIFSTTEKITPFKNCKNIIDDKICVKGIWNENNQLKTIKNALNTIDDDALVIKTRSDQRIYNELALTGIDLIHNSYKSENTFDGSRLGIISNNSTIMKINNISDHFYVGNAKLLKKMFNISFREKDIFLKSIDLDEKNICEIRDKLKSSFYTELEAEQWFFNSFRKNCHKKNFEEETLINSKTYVDKLSNYLDLLKDSIYVIDPEDLDLYWTKDTINTLPSFYHNNKQNFKTVDCIRLTRLNWLCLLNDDEYKEKILTFAESLNSDHFLY